MQFKMPWGKTLEIRCSAELEEEPRIDEKLDGVFYELYWGNNKLPWHTNTRLEATIIALGVQYGAYNVNV